MAVVIKNMDKHAKCGNCLSYSKCVDLGYNYWTWGCELVPEDITIGKVKYTTQKACEKDTVPDWCPMTQVVECQSSDELFAGKFWVDEVVFNDDKPVSCSMEGEDEY